MLRSLGLFSELDIALPFADFRWLGTLLMRWQA
jgi:hypothetical protein